MLVTAQVLGYMLSKFIGIKVIAEMPPHRRAALAARPDRGRRGRPCCCSPSTPPPFNLVWLFCNGLPLGMVFGLVLGFLEGRRQTEALAAGLCTSFIVADGVDQVGRHATCWQRACSEYWMPFVAGLLFAAAAGALRVDADAHPAPSAEDVAARSERTPMNGADAGQFFPPLRRRPDAAGAGVSADHGICAASGPTSRRRSGRACGRRDPIRGLHLVGDGRGARRAVCSTARPC